MNDLASLKESIAPDLDRLNRLIRQRLASDNPLMSQVIEQNLACKGKQIRPIVVMLCARMTGTVSERVLNAAGAVELLHNASLIHDDVIDESKLRRSRPTVNAIWDNHIAVLVGDYFVSTALQLAIATDDLRIVDEIGRLGRMLSLGEIDQIYNAREHSLTEEGYFRIIGLKTASLFVACARVGCYAAGATDEQTRALSRIAELLGLCFQIRDDIFDYYDGDSVGKPTGNDLREGKITLPLLHVLLDPNLPAHNAMNQLASQPELSDADVDCLYDFARSNGGIDYAYSVMEDLRQQAARIASELPGHEPLMSVFDYIIARDR